MLEFNIQFMKSQCPIIFTIYLIYYVKLYIVPYISPLLMGRFRIPGASRFG
jgi:hypothetical protein